MPRRRPAGDRGVARRQPGRLASFGVGGLSLDRRLTDLHAAAAPVARHADGPFDAAMTATGWTCTLLIVGGQRPKRARQVPHAGCYFPGIHKPVDTRT